MTALWGEVTITAPRFPSQQVSNEQLLYKTFGRTLIYLHFF